MMKIWMAVALAMALAPAPAFAQLKIGVIASSTGATAVVGIPQKNTAALLPKKIGDLTVEYLVFDDASDATQTVIIVKKLLAEHKIDALIGPSGSPNAVSVVPFMAEAGTPMLAPVGATAVVLPMDDKKRWVFKTTQNDPLISEALVGHMVKSGVKTVGVIGFNDPYGDNWYAVFSAQAREGRHQGGRERKIPAHRRFGDGPGGEGDVRQARRRARRRGGRSDGAAARHARRRRLQGSHLPDAWCRHARLPAPGRSEGRRHRARREPDAGAARNARQPARQGRRAGIHRRL